MIEVDYYIGIDPSRVMGKTYGGIAIMDYYGDPVAVIKMNTTPFEIYKNIKDIVRDKSCVAVIEDVWAMSGQGASSSFNFGHGCGVIEGILCSLNIPYDFIGPKKWMKSYGLKKEKSETTASWKSRICSYQDTLFHGFNNDKYLCDSLLIGRYAFNNKEFFDFGFKCSQVSE